MVLGGCQCDRIRVLGVPVLCTSAALDEEETFDSPAQGRLFRLHHGSGIFSIVPPASHVILEGNKGKVY
uniref:Uncharacterized protein n=1 Tax=Aegilops tauschii TaxID=37682 RepID=M8CX80_AEGTA